jgi:hypothetical protein
MQMANKTTVVGQLKNLINKTVQIKELVKIIKSLDSLQKKNSTILKYQINPYDGLEMTNFINPSTGDKLVQDVSEMWVDFSYQRYLKLQPLLDRLTMTNGELLPARASVINVRLRSDGTKVIWDGLRRAVMSGLKGIWQLPTLCFPHTSEDILEQRAVEAKDFSAFNGRGMESMRKEEIWKADYIAQDPIALELGDVMRSCNIDVLNVLCNGGWSIGGFAVFYAYAVGNKKIEVHYLQQASRIIQRAFNTDNSMSSYLLTGIALYLKTVHSLQQKCVDNKSLYPCEYIDDLDHSEHDLSDLLTDYKLTEKSQGDIISPAETGKQEESAAFNFFRFVVKESITDVKTVKGLTDIFIKEYGLSKDVFFQVLDK